MHSSRETAILFFVALIVTGSFISLNFFVSFVVDGFYAAQGQSDEEQTEEIYYEWIQVPMPHEQFCCNESMIPFLARAAIDASDASHSKTCLLARAHTRIYTQ